MLLQMAYLHLQHELEEDPERYVIGYTFVEKDITFYELHAERHLSGNIMYEKKNFKGRA